jgi:hypothetical protein
MGSILAPVSAVKELCHKIGCEKELKAVNPFRTGTVGFNFFVSACKLNKIYWLLWLDFFNIFSSAKYLQTVPCQEAMHMQSRVTFSFTFFASFCTLSLL